MRVVIDTNVVVSGLLLPDSVSRKAVDAARKGGVILVSAAMLDELDDVLCRRKFDEYVSEEQRLEFLAAYVREAVDVVVNETVRACRDPSDDKVLELAVSGKATHVISGDPDLLVLSPFRDVAILMPGEFVRWHGEFPLSSVT